MWEEIDLNCGLTAYNEAIEATVNVSYSYLQSALLSTAHSWYPNASSAASGEDAFLLSIANLTETYPNEIDLRAWYGLSLLNVAIRSTFDSEGEPEAMLKAREILKEALQREPSHPGLLHYLIHAYDVAPVGVAEKGQEYAFLYNKIAETASHGQHMATHIWTRTGEILLEGLRTKSTCIIRCLVVCFGV